MERTLPHNLEAERAVLGSILIENARLDDAAALVDGSMFFRKAHTEIWLALLALQERKIEYDLITLRDELERRQKLEDVGGAAYVSALVDGVPRSTNVDHYAQIVRDKAHLRRLIKVSSEVIEGAFTADVPAEDMIDLAIQRTAALGDGASQVEFETAETWMASTAEVITARIQDPRDVTGVETSVVKLDLLTRGFQPGSLYYVGARPAVGKSALALQMALHAAKNGIGVVYVSLEMSKQQLGNRAVALEAQVNAFKLSTGKIDEWEQRRVAAAWSRISGWPFYIIDAHNLTPARIRAMIRRMVARNGIRLAVVDYMQLLHDTERHQSRNHELEAISRGFKTMSLDLGISSIVLSQLSRPHKDHKGPPPIPRLTDLRDSGALEQDADGVFLLHRFPLKDDADTDTEDGLIIVAKQREGPNGLCKMHFIGSLTLWKERSIPAPEQQQELPSAAPWEER